MSTIVFQEDVRIPLHVGDLESFRTWAKSDEFPERGRYSFLNGELWVDLVPEQLFTHNDVRMEYGAIIRGLLKASRRGRFFGDGTLVTNVSAGLSTEPDGTIALFNSLENRSAQLAEAEITGTPDAVLEVVSANSVRKDTVVLRELYWQAGIPEYWLVDARGEALQFDIFQRGEKEYVAVQQIDGWMQSAVLERSFKLSRQSDRAGNPEFTLEVK